MVQNIRIIPLVIVMVYIDPGNIIFGNYSELQYDTEICNWTDTLNIDDILYKRSNNSKLGILNSSNTAIS